MSAKQTQVDEFPAVSAKDIALAMTTLKDSPTTLMFHAEMLPLGSDAEHAQPAEVANASYRAFLDSRPPAFETCAVAEILSMANLAPRLHLHVVHLSATECIPMLREARRSGVNITAETCFHYLGLASDGIADGDTRHKCCPPIRSLANQDRLWDELADADGWTLRAADMRWKNRCSPWEGRAFGGRVHETWVRGQRVFRLGGENGGFVGGRPVGEAIVERRTAYS